VDAGDVDEVKDILGVLICYVLGGAIVDALREDVIEAFIEVSGLLDTSAKVIALVKGR
jgi:hypothetical protein